MAFPTLPLGNPTFLLQQTCLSQVSITTNARSLKVSVYHKALSENSTSLKLLEALYATSFKKKKNPDHFLWVSFFQSYHSPEYIIYSLLSQQSSLQNNTHNDEFSPGSSSTFVTGPSYAGLYWPSEGRRSRPSSTFSCGRTVKTLQATIYRLWRPCKPQYTDCEDPASHNIVLPQSNAWYSKRCNYYVVIIIIIITVIVTRQGLSTWLCWDVGLWGCSTVWGTRLMSC